MIPHNNDTGGYFVAILRKIKDRPVSNKTTKAKGKPTFVTPKATRLELHPVSSSTLSRDFQHLVIPLVEFFHLHLH
jgi:hypothetical protein